MCCMIKNTNSDEFTKYINKLAYISNLKLSDKDIGYLVKTLENALDILKNLEKVDVKGIPETVNPSSLQNVFRQDVIDTKNMFTVDEALSNAKRTYKYYFVISSINKDKS